MIYKRFMKSLQWISAEAEMKECKITICVQKSQTQSKIKGLELTAESGMCACQKFKAFSLKG